MTDFAERLNKVIKYLDTSNYRIAKDLNMSKSTIGNYVKGVNEPTGSKLNQLAEYFSHSINQEWFISGIGEMKKEKEVVKNTNGNTYYEKGDGSYNVVAEVIPFDAYASYIETIEDATVHHDFEEVIFNVDRIGKGNYKAFRIKGDSMNGGSIDDVPDQALVLGRELGRHHWKDGFHKTKHGFIILCKENIFHKDIVDFDKETGDITCHSRNKSPEYSDFTINLNEVYQIFKIIKRFM